VDCLYLLNCEILHPFTSMPANHAKVVVFRNVTYPDGSLVLRFFSDLFTASQVSKYTYKNHGKWCTIASR
jgi:hypothetical protein